MVTFANQYYKRKSFKCVIGDKYLVNETLGIWLTKHLCHTSNTPELSPKLQPV